MSRKAICVSILAILGFFLPSVSLASGLTAPQINAFIGFLQAFNIEQTIVAHIRDILAGASAALPAGDPAPADPPATPHIPVIGSVYSASNIGYDLSFNTVNYPTIPFGFGVVGVTRGKAFKHNDRIVTEYSWARFGTNRPTLYINLNAPYGTTVAGNVRAPKSCPENTNTEPTACEGYNYGFNAAADAFAYAKGAGVSSPLWWLDIEEANSWSPDVAVNDATIQGAIDYLNTQNIRVGVYSVPRMWRDIAGEGFAPTQALGGQTVTTPSWFPIGISNQVSALNTCNTSTSFMPGSPVWIIQYVADSTAVDQNIAC